MADQAQAQDQAQPQNVVVQTGPQGQINLKVEQSKLPVFYGIRKKDTSMAAHMIECVEGTQGHQGVVRRGHLIPLLAVVARFGTRMGQDSATSA